MSSASGAALAPSLRRLPFTVCLAPDFVNPLLTANPPEDPAPATGLLLGVVDNTTVHVRQAFPCHLAERQLNGVSTGIAAMDEARKKAELRGFTVLGWYAHRKPAGLEDADIEFHKRLFRHPGDLGMIIRPESETEITCELYCRSVEGLLTAEDYRWGALRVPKNTPLTTSAEITMRSPLRDDFFLRAYSQAYDDGSADRSVARYLPAITAASRRLSLWLAFALIFGLAAALTFLIIRFKVLPSENVVALTNVSSPLGLKVQAEGERILVTWNRNGTVVRDAISGRLVIDDGKQHRVVNLDPGQVAYGSVLYTPRSAEVAFHLELFGADGRASGETLRILDASKDPSEGPAAGLKLTPAPGTATTSAAKTEITNRTELSDRRAPQAKTLPDVNGVLPGSTSAPASAPASAQASSVPPPSGALTPQPAANVPATTSAAGSAALTAPATPSPSSTNENEMARQNMPANVVADAPSSGPPAQKLPAASAPAASAPQTSASGAPQTSSPNPSQTSSPVSTAPVPQNNVPLHQEPPPAASPKSPGASNVPTNALPSTYRPPQPTRQVMPDTHFLSPGIIANGGRVDITVAIDEKGRVLNARLISNQTKVSSALTTAAMNAARAWKFRPAFMNGKAIPSEHTIQFLFNPLKR